MFVRRAALVSLLTLPAFGCPKKPAAVSQAPQPQVQALPNVAEPVAVTRNVQRYKINAEVHGIADMLDAFSKAATFWGANDPPNARAELEAALLSSGFGPGFLGNIDLAGVHGGTFEYPHEGQEARPEDARFSGFLAVLDGRKVIENMPGSMRPQPLGGGLWEMISEDVRVLVREQAKALEFGSSPQQLDRASALPASMGKGRRLKFSVENVPLDDVDPSELFELPRDSKLARDLASVVQGLGAMALEADLGTDRDLQLYAEIRAPFEKLGLEPLGTPRTEPTALDRALPPDPLVALTLSWGDPALLHKIMDREIPLDQIPDPFAAMVREAMKHSHVVLDAVANDVALALYSNKKDGLTLVLAADVKDEATALTAVRGLNDVMRQAAEAQAKLAGDDAKAKIKVSFKPDGLRFTGARADHLSVTLPADARDEPFIKAVTKKGRLDAITLVKNNIVVVAIGLDSRALAASVARNVAGTGQGALADDAGLIAARGLGGCQLCGALDLPKLLQLTWFTKLEDMEGKQLRAAKAIHRSLLSLDAPALGGGFRVEPGQAAGGISLPKAWMTLDSKTTQAIREAASKLNDPDLGE